MTRKYLPLSVLRSLPALQPGRRLIGGGLALALAVAVGALLAGLFPPAAAPAQAQGMSPTKVWEATLTAGDSFVLGYRVNSQFLAYGDLAPNAGPFTWPGDDSGQPLYVDHLYHSQFPEDAPLVFGFADWYHYNPQYPYDPDDDRAGISRFPGPRPASFDAVLCVSGRAFPFDETDFIEPARSGRYAGGYVEFQEPGVRWSRGDRAEVSLWAVADKNGNHGNLCGPETDGLDPLNPLPADPITSDPHARVADDDLPCPASGTNQPRANANGDFNVRYDRTALLDGSLTRNHAGNVDDTLSYRWTQISGPAAIVLEPDSVSTDFHMPLFAAPAREDKPPKTELEFLLCVTATDGSTRSDTMLVNMVDVTPKPTADTGFDQIVEPGATVTLTGDGSYNPYEAMMGGNPDSPWKMDYQWEQVYGPDVMLSDATVANPTFTAPTAAGELMAFQLTVTTRLGDSHTGGGGGEFNLRDDFAFSGGGGIAFVVVKFANAGADPTAAPGETVYLDGSASRNPFTDPRTNSGLIYEWVLVRSSIRTPDGDEPDAYDANYDGWYSEEASYGERGSNPQFTFTVPQDTPHGVTAEFRLFVEADWPNGRHKLQRVDSMMLTVVPASSNSRVVGESGQVDQGTAEPNRAPVFTDGSETTRSIAENPAGGENVGAAVSATDADGDTLTYSLTGTDAGSFAINIDTGQILTKPGVIYDYETQSTYTLTLNANDGNGALSAIVVTVSLTDVDESAFVTACFTDLSALTAAAEHAGAWDDPACVSHHREDSPARYFHFTLSEETEVSVSLSHGALFVSRAAPQNGWGTPPKSAEQDRYERRNEKRRARGKLVHDGLHTGSNEVTLTLAAGDYTAEAAATTGGGSFTISIAPPASQAASETQPNRVPVFDEGSAATRSIAENTGAGVKVGDAIAATDDDGDTLKYSLSGTDAASFAIDEDNGQIATVEGVTYDFEARTSYSLTVNANDGNGGTASIAVTVSLTNVNEAPAFSEGDSTTRAVAENSPAGTEVGDAIAATDPDGGDTLTYSLSGTDASSFEIGDSTGQLTTKSDVTYDYETKSSYELTVEADDGRGGTASIAVTVTLTNVAEATPVTACFTNLGTLTAAADYAGSWDDADCKAHHQDSRARYFHFTLSEETTVSISLSAGVLYVSKDTPQNGWGATPKGTYEHRKNVRRGNGKLVHDGGNSATLTLAAGEYTAEAAGGSADFTLSIAPQ